MKFQNGRKTALDFAGQNNPVAGGEAKNLKNRVIFPAIELAIALKNWVIYPRKNRTPFFGRSAPRGP
jgi:hypothetical protein